jgi:hypothetical protein
MRIHQPKNRPVRPVRSKVPTKEVAMPYHGKSPYGGKSMTEYGLNEERGAWREDGARFPHVDMNRREMQDGTEMLYVAHMPGNPGYSPGASEKIGSVMREYKAGTLKSSSGAPVKSRAQAAAIGISEARRRGFKIPKKGE